MFSISPPYDSLAYGFQVVLNVLWSAVFLDMFFSFCFAHFAKVCSCYSLLLLSSSHFLFFLIQHHDKKIFCSSLQEPEMNEFQKKRLTIEEVSCCMWGSCKTKTVNSTYSIMSSLLLVPDACTCVCLTVWSELIGDVLLSAIFTPVLMLFLSIQYYLLLFYRQRRAYQFILTEMILSKQ